MDLQQKSLLGLPHSLDAVACASLSAALQRMWTVTVGAPPADLTADLQVCRRWFDPVAQGQRLRRELSGLPPLPLDIVDPGPPLTLTVDPQRRLVTPEGRCALDLLERLPDSQRHTIGDGQLMPYERLLAGLYRDWTRHRLQSVLDLLTGSTKPLQVPAAGVVIALLVNRCTDERRALTRFASGSERHVVDAAFFAPVQAFADILNPKRRANRSNPRLVSGWMLYEARRRLGGGLVVEDARGGRDGKVWIQPEAESAVIDVVTRDLVRGHRARASPQLFAAGFDALVIALRRELPKLAAFGLVHERPLDTQRLRERLLQSLRSQLDTP